MQSASSAGFVVQRETCALSKTEVSLSCPQRTMKHLRSSLAGSPEAEESDVAGCKDVEGAEFCHLQLVRCAAKS